jgi:Xaa-Pro dipeptidase
MYCSDLTRTIFLGDPGDRLKRAYEVVREAQNAGLAQIREGASAESVDAAARDVIDASEFKGLFIHSFGHGIGMDIHQPIFVSPRSRNILKAGNVISAEPGIYIPGLGGIRIEDTVLVTEEGYRLLTDYDHGLTIV